MAGSLGRVLVSAIAATLLSPAPDAGAAERTYVNPVSAPVADAFADPAVIRGKDGRWYAFGTSDPLREGERTRHLIPLLRSADLVRWEYAGDVFTAANRPAWAAPGSGLWAPDVRYLNGRYLLYFTVTDTTANPGGDSAIGVATAPTPAGPWTDSGGPVVAPTAGERGGYRWTFDPAVITDTAGRNWLYYGSYYGGLFVVPLTADGLRTDGPAVRVAAGDRYEGAYVVRRGEWYYLFGSAANCCAGPATGYSVFAGRSRHPTGPFLDRDGISLLAPAVGGTPVIQPNGNGWIGTGHNSVLTDAAGQDWFVYHAIHRDDPFLDEPYGINERPMLIDRLDWIDGWPVVRAGAGASTGRRRAPVAVGVLDDRFERAGLGSGWRPSPGWTVPSTTDPDSGGLLRHVHSDIGTLSSTVDVPRNVHVELDLRVSTTDGAAGVRLRSHSSAEHVSVTVDRRAGALILADRHGERRAALPAGFAYHAWHTLTVRVTGSTLTAAVTSARLGDPVAQVDGVLPRHWAGGGLAVTARGVAELDNVSAARASDDPPPAVPAPRVGRPDRAHSDEFDGSLDPAWTWVRPDPAAVVAGGALRWPVQAGDLVGAANPPSVLLRDAPEGDYVVQTRLDLDLGADTERNFQQAGLVAYVGDDDFARLSHVAIWRTRQVEYARELPFAGRLSFGGMALTAPAPSVWLRLAHRVDPATGEHRFRGAVSRDGEHWTWGGTWTFPAASRPRIGLGAHGGDLPTATAVFDHFRVYPLRFEQDLAEALLQ